MQNKPNIFARAWSWLRGNLVEWSHRLDALGEVLLANIFSILTLVLVFAFYWQFDQAKDMLITLNQEPDWMVGLFFASLIILAGMCWYFPHLSYPENGQKIKRVRDLFVFELKPKTRSRGISITKKEVFVNKYKTLIPRTSGVLVILIVAFGMLNVATTNKADYLGMLSFLTPAQWLLIIMGILLILGPDNRTWLVERLRLEGVGSKNNVQTYGTNGALLLVLVLMLVFMFLNQKDFESLSFLIWSGIMVSIGFLIFTLLRKHVFLFAKDRNVIVLLFYASLICSGVFVLFNIYPDLAQNINPLICFNFGIICYLVIIYTLRIVSVHTQIIILFFVFIAIVASYRKVNSPLHQVSYITPNPYPAQEREAADTYFDNWLTERRPYIEDYLAQDGHEFFPIFVVSAEGGGSRAAFWSILVQSYLQNETDGAYYDQHLLGLTGASGGSTGNSSFFSMMQADVPTDSLPSYADRIFSENYLSSSLTMLLGRDALQNILGVAWFDDRAKALENEWARQITQVAGKTAGDNFRAPYLSHWYDKGMTLKDPAPPLLVLNATYIQSGGQAISTPVEVDEDYYLGLDLLNQLQRFSPEKTLAVRTLNLLNASFPYVNPAGQIDSIGSFADAGYFDNHGSRSATALMNQFRDYREASPDTLLDKLKLISLLVINSTVDRAPDSEPVQLTVLPDNEYPSETSQAFQTFAPVQSISGLRTGLMKEHLYRLKLAADTVYQFQLKRAQIKSSKGQDIIPIVPLARYLSPDARKAILAWGDSTETQALVKTVVDLMK